MLGFSIQKLLFTVGIVVAIWYGFKWVGRMNAIREKNAKDKLRRTASNSGNAGSSAAGDAEDMLECASCGAFVASRGAKSCGRADCPYPG